MHLVFHGVALAQVGDPHLVVGLADALDAAFALLLANGIPGKVDVDQGAESLQIEALGCCIGAEQHLDLALAHPVFEQGGVAALEAPTQPEAGTVAAGVEADHQIAGDVGVLGQLHPHPTQGVLALR